MAVYNATTKIKTIKIGGNQISKILLGETLVWENLISGTYSTSKTWVAQGGGATSKASITFNIATGARVTSVTMSSSNTAGYFLSARKTTSDSWVPLADGVLNETVTIFDKNIYYYFQFGVTGDTSGWWQDGAGWWHVQSGNITLNYLYKPTT